jgi:hypothetical protein
MAFFQDVALCPQLGDFAPKTLDFKLQAGSFGRSSAGSATTIAAPKLLRLADFIAFDQMANSYMNSMPANCRGHASDAISSN